MIFERNFFCRSRKYSSCFCTIKGLQKTVSYLYYYKHSFRAIHVTPALLLERVSKLQIKRASSHHITTRVLISWLFDFYSVKVIHVMLDSCWLLLGKGGRSHRGMLRNYDNVNHCNLYEMLISSSKSRSCTETREHRTITLNSVYLTKCTLHTFITKGRVVTLRNSAQQHSRNCLRKQLWKPSVFLGVCLLRTFKQPHE